MLCVRKNQITYLHGQVTRRSILPQIVWNMFNVDVVVDVVLQTSLLGKSDEVFEPAQLLREAAQEGRHQLHEFGFRNYFLIKQSQTPQEVLVDFLTPQRLSNLITKRKRYLDPNKTKDTVIFLYKYNSVGQQELSR